MIVLADYNLNRQAILISGSLLVSGLLDLAPIQFKTFGDVGLPADSNDRWPVKTVERGCPSLASQKKEFKLKLDRKSRIRH